MKKSLLILCLLGSLALTLSGCTKEKVVLLNPPENAAQQNMAQIKFSGEVDQDSVLQSAIAFAPDATPKGYFTWKDSMTLEYFLENPDDVKAFSIIFQKPIKDKSGTIIEAPTKIDFFTQSKNTKLLFQVPQDKDQNIQGKAPITLMWSTPVFNLQNAADTKALLGKNITLTPAIEGSWQMLGSTGLLFEPFEAWKPSNQYQVSVSQNLGVEPVSFSFTTPKLEITNIEAQDLIEKKGLDVYFNQEVDLAKIQASLTLSPSIGFDLSYGEETIWEDGEPIKKTSKKIIHLTPRTTWTPQESYTLSLSPGAYSLSGLLPCEAQKQTFTTIDSFGVDRFEPPWSVFGPISLNFSHPVKATDLLASLVIKPGLEKEKWAEYVKAFNFQDDYESRWFSLPPLENETWKAGEDYQITISKNLADTYGRSLGTDFTETFTTSYPNQVTPFFLPTFESVIDKTAQIKPSFKYSGNVESVDIEFKKLFPGSAEWFSNEFLTPSPNQMSFWDLDLRKTFPKILDDNGDIGVGKYEINFTFNITGQNYPSRWGTSFYASDFGVLLKSFTENRIEFSAIDFEGQPIVGKGALMGYDYEGKQVYKDNDTEFPTTEKNLNHVNDFLIQIGDQSGIGSRNFQRKINPYDGKLNFSPWEYETLYKGVVITDRPLFSPGQKVYLKSLFREKNLSGKVFPLKSAKDLSKAYRIEIQDPFWKTIGEFKGTSLDG
ncbi:MAG TPA: Ig-like domain-containing protein, partial [Candidatus Gracilibacteria bacterium]